MKYRKHDAKDYARQNMVGIWAAALTPFKDDLTLNESGFRHNIEHWVGDLEIEGVFISGKQGEFFSMSLEERKGPLKSASRPPRKRTPPSCHAPTKTWTR